MTQQRSLVPSLTCALTRHALNFGGFVFILVSVRDRQREGTLAREMSSPLKVASKTLSHSHSTHVELRGGGGGEELK